MPGARSSSAVRSVALLETAKGLLVLLAGIGALGFIHHDAQRFAEQLVGHLHLNPARATPRIFLEFAAQVNDARLARLAAFAAGYAALRFVEAYGLARERRWAEWFAVISGAVYIPFEVINLFRGEVWLALGALAVNIAVVGIMLQALLRGHVPARVEPI